MSGNVSALLCLLTLSSLLAAPLSASPEAKVDLNTATVEELDSLPGIGLATARRIVEFRTQNGPFKKVEDLMNVKGIGEKKFLRLKDRITLGPQPASPSNPRP